VGPARRAVFPIVRPAYPLDWHRRKIVFEKLPRVRRSEIISLMKTTLLASGLGFPEGPVVMADGRIVLCDGNTGELLVYAGGSVSAYARTGGSPWGAVLGSDGAIYVTQGGDVPGSSDTGAVLDRVSGPPGPAA
jgi:sugar lactone lactonase YvrE